MKLKLLWLTSVFLAGLFSAHVANPYVFVDGEDGGNECEDTMALTLDEYKERMEYTKALQAQLVEMTREMEGK